MKSSLIQTIFGSIFVVVGICMIPVGIFQANKTIYALNHYEKTTGEVMEMVRNTSTSNHGRTKHSSYSPTVNFTDAGGQSVTFTSDIGANPPQHKVHDIVPVLYDPQNPQKARINTFFELWFPTMICIGLGTVFIIAGLWVCRMKMGRTRPRQSPYA